MERMEVQMKLLTWIVGLGLAVGCAPTGSDVIDPPTTVVEDEPSLAGCSVLTTSDWGADGHADGEDLKVYDDQGRLIKSHHDKWDDFIPAEGRTYFYNDLNQLVLEEVYWNNQNEVDWLVEHSYDERGNRVRSTSSQDFFGAALVVMTYDVDDLLISREWDWAGDGVFDSRTEYVYNEHGQRTEEWVFDPVGGVVQQVVRQSFDAQGQRTRWELDVGDDGTVENTQTFDYDLLGRLVSWSHDMNGDGVVDGSLLYVYDAKSQVVETRQFVGALELRDLQGITVFEYNENGWLVREAYDYQLDGSFEFVTTVAYDCL